MASDNSTSFFLDIDDENDDSKYFDQAGGASDDNEVEEDDHVTLSATGEAAEAVRQGETEDEEGATRALLQLKQLWTKHPPSASGT